MIYGRSANLYLGVLLAGLSVASLLSAQLGYPIPTEIVAAIGALFGSVIGLLSGNDQLAVAKGAAALARIDAKQP